MNFIRFERMMKRDLQIDSEFYVMWSNLKRLYKFNPDKKVSNPYT